MKKKAIFTLLALLSLGACTNPEVNSSSENSLGQSSDTSQSNLDSSQETSDLSSSFDSDSTFTSSSSSETSEAPIKTWGEEEQQTMREHLYGEVLPYIDLEEVLVEYDEEYEELDILGFDQVTQEDLQAYASLFIENDWEDASDLYESLPDNIYVFEKIVQTDEGKRFIDVQFYAMDDYYEPADTGYFVLFAWDPYEYEFPTDEFDIGILENTGSEYHVPAFEAEYYILSTDYYEVLCVTSDTDAETKYTDILQEAEFTILDERDEYGYLNAISPDGKFAVAYVYDPYLGGLDILLIEVPAMPTQQWPSEELAEAFQNYNQPAFTIPEMTFDGAMYLGYESDSNLLYYLRDQKDKINFVIEVSGATVENLNSYVDLLKTSGWVLDESSMAELGDGTKILTKEIDDKIAKIDLSLATDVVIIHVYLFLQEKPVEAWPLDEIKACLGDEYITDVVPAYDGTKAIGYQVHEAWFLSEAYVEILVAEGDEDEVLQAYQSVLTTSGFTPYDKGEENEYLSPNKQLVIQLEKQNEAVYVYFYAAILEAWPTNVVDGEFAKHEYTDPLPGLSDVAATFDYKLSPFGSPDGFQIEVTPDSDPETAVQELIDLYKEILENANFTLSEKDDPDLSDEVIYESPNKQYEVEFWIQARKTLVILINPLN